MSFWKRFLAESSSSPKLNAELSLAPLPPAPVSTRPPTNPHDEIEFFYDLAKYRILDDSRRERWSEQVSDIEGAVSRFIEQGWLRNAAPAEHLEWVSLAELKSMLRELGAKVSGRKPELAQRLSELLPSERLAAIVSQLRLYAPTEVGAQMLAVRDDLRHRERQEFEASLMELLRQGNAAAACDAAGSLGQDRRIAALLALDFSDAAVSEDRRLLIGPTLAVSELVGEGVRMAGRRLLDACGGTFSCPELERWLSNKPVCGYASLVLPDDMRGLAELYAHTKLFTASNLAKWVEAREGDWPGVEILSTDDCPACASGKRAFRGKELSGQPPVPRHWGCRCLLVTLAE